MELSSKKVYEVLARKNVKILYHANSVVTACQFLRHGALLSRGTVERLGIHQTAQDSDKLDKKYGIWFDVFTDTVDIHERASRRNVYGPALFALDVNLLLEASSPMVSVTKLNPTKWNGRRIEECWFTSMDDLEKNFSKGTFDQMVVFRNCGGEVSLRNHLQKIILDDPLIEVKKGKIDYYSMAYGAMKYAALAGGIQVRIRKRECVERCKCKEEYTPDSSLTDTMYVLES